MKNVLLITALVLLISSASFGQFDSRPSTDKNTSLAATQPIKGWRVPIESGRQNYEVYLDTIVRHGGNSSVSIKSKLFDNEDKQKTVYLMQTIKGDNYHGKRIRLSAFVKSENVEHSALWLRMDGDGMKVLNFDGMNNRSINGTADWQKFDIVLDVPSETRQIIFGINLKGSGQIWLDDVELEEVGSGIASTSAKSPAEWEIGSAKRIEQYKSTNKDDYDKQLRAFQERNVTASCLPVNLDFEN
jgi:hypothetical protein